MVLRKKKRRGEGQQNGFLFPNPKILSIPVLSFRHFKPWDFGSTAEGSLCRSLKIQGSGLVGQCIPTVSSSDFTLVIARDSLSLDLPFGSEEKLIPEFWRQPLGTLVEMLKHRWFLMILNQRIDDKSKQKERSIIRRII